MMDEQQRRRMDEEEFRDMMDWAFFYTMSKAEFRAPERPWNRPPFVVARPED
jgi:hypothetical protein